MATRKRVSERTFIDASGNEVDRMEQATGARYSLVHSTGQDADGEPIYTPLKQFDVQLGPAAAEATMYGVFGFWTKIGNVANTVLNDKDAPGSIEDAAAEIDDFMASVAGGVWREAGEAGARAPKYDTAILAEVLIKLLGDKAKGDIAYYKAKLNDSKGEADPANKGYRAKVVSRDDIKAAYWRLAKERGITKPDAAVDSLA